MIHRIVVGCVLFASGLAAQSSRALLLPGQAAGYEMSAASTHPWGSGAAATRTLAIYSAGLFTAYGIGAPLWSGPVTITALRWRANGGGGGGDSTYANVSVSLSTTLAPSASAVSTFAANHGPDLTIVYAGPVRVLPGVVSAPSSNFVTIPLATPFSYDPAVGDLVVDVQCTGTGWTAPAVGAAADAELAGGGMVTAAGAGAPTGTVTPFQVPVLEVSTNLPPLPFVVINEVVYDATAPGHDMVELYSLVGPVFFPGVPLELTATNSAGTTTIANLSGIFSLSDRILLAEPGWAGPAVPDGFLLGSLPNGRTTLALRLNGVVFDAVEYGGSSGSPPLLRGERAPLFGAHVHDPVAPTSWSRHRDGVDSDYNSVDFRVAPWTPGASNDVPSLLPYASTFDTLAVGQALPSWGGSAGAPVAVDPTALGTFNPKVVPAFSGNRCAAFATPNDTAGGRSYWLATDGTQRLGLSTQVYFDATPTPVGQSYAWSIGVGGTTDIDFAMPFPTGPASSDVNGDTGVSWTYRVTSAGANLYLVAHGGGGNIHQILAEYPVTTSAWRELQLATYDGKVFARYDGDLSQAPVAPSQGGLYVGIRNAAPGAALAAFRMDDTDADNGEKWSTPDMGAGCDGNCPPKNGAARKVDRDVVVKLELTDKLGMYAIPVEPLRNSSGAFIPYSFTAACVLTHLQSGEVATSATLTLRDVGTDGEPGALLGSPSSATLMDPFPNGEEDPDGWWGASVGQVSQAGLMFLVFDYDGTLELPIAAETDTFKPEFTPYYYHLEGGVWKLYNEPIAWAYKFACSGTAGRTVADIKGAAQLGTTFQSTLGCAYAGAFTILFTSFVPIVPGLDMGFLGAPGCKVYIDPGFGFALGAIGDATGHAAISLTVPNAPATLGVQAFQQWMVAEPTVNAWGWTFSNALRLTIH